MKKSVVLFLGIVLILSMSFCFAIEDFSDVPETHWAYQAIQVLKKYDILKGYPDGTFQPNHFISRAEFAKIIVNVLDLDSSKAKNINYSDVNQKHWAYQYIKTISPLLSNQDVKFFPDEPIIREDVATILIKAVEWENKEYNAKTIEKFTDKNFISGDATKYIAIAVENELMNGNADGSFNPKGGLTRAEVAKLIYNVYLKFNHLHFEQFDAEPVMNNKISIPDSIKNNSSANYTDKVEYTEDGHTYVRRVGKIREESFDVTYEKSNANNSSFGFDIVINNQLLRDGNTYSLNSNDKIYVFMNNAYTTNFITYMFSYGNATQVKKVFNSVAIITVPTNMPAGRIRLIIEGTSKNNTAYATSTQALNFNYTNTPVVIVKEDAITKPLGQWTNENVGSSNITKDIDFIVVFNGDTLASGATLANAKVDQKIIVRGKPVSNMQGIRYRWDNDEIEYMEGATGTISIPKSFKKNSEHQLTIVVIGKDGNVSELKKYQVIISPAY